MLQAVTAATSWSKLKAPDEFAKPAAELTAAQDRIIDVLRKLLDVTRQAQAEVLAEMKKRPGGDLPDDVKQKLEEIRDKLDKFLEAAEEGDRGQREPGQDAGRGFHARRKRSCSRGWPPPRTIGRSS